VIYLAAKGSEEERKLERLRRERGRRERKLKKRHAELRVYNVNMNVNVVRFGLRYFPFPRFCFSNVQTR